MHFLFALLVVFILASLFLNTTALASGSVAPSDIYNQEVSDYAQDMQSRYKVSIKYPMRTDGYTSIGVASLQTLDKSLDYISANFIKSLSSFYNEKYGKHLTIEFVYLNNDNLNIDTSSLGYFSSSACTIYLFMPSSSVGSTVSGCSPFTISHEIGHAFSFYLTNRHGYQQLESYWTRFNYGNSYTPNPISNLDRHVFASIYACTSFDEDFAETFSYMFTCNRAGLGIGDRFYNEDKTITGLGRKVNYLETNIRNFMQNDTEIQNSLNIMRLTPAHINYEDTELSGNSLEYINFSPPYGVLDNVLTTLKIDQIRSQWVYEVGGWKVLDARGGVYLVFPGARYVTLKIPKR